MENMPLVSVVMSTAASRDAGYLMTAVQSVLKQTFTDFELLLCSDGAEKEQQDYLLRLFGADERVRLIGSPERKGLARCLNLCIREARGKYLARMDDDDICRPDRLEIQFGFLESHPEIDFVGCNAGLICGNKIWGYRKMPENPEKRDFLKFLPYIHPSVMFRRSVFEDREAYRTGTCRGEDYELFMRLAARGCRGYNIQQTLYFYREDLDSYKKRTCLSRLDEVKIRCRGFRMLGILLPDGWLYALRPLAAWMVPSVLIYRAKRLYHFLEEGRHGG